MKSGQCAAGVGAHTILHKDTCDVIQMLFCFKSVYLHRNYFPTYVPQIGYLIFVTKMKIMKFNRKDLQII